MPGRPAGWPLWVDTMVQGQECARFERFVVTGIAGLVSVATQAGESDISLCLVRVQGRPVRKALAAAELTEPFEIFPTVRRHMTIASIPARHFA